MLYMFNANISISGSINTIKIVLLFYSIDLNCY